MKHLPEPKLDGTTFRINHMYAKYTEDKDEVACTVCLTPTKKRFTFAGADSYIPTKPRAMCYGCAIKKALRETLGVFA